MPKIPPFVGEFSDDDVKWFIAVGENRHVAPGEAVIVEGQRPADIFFVLEGVFRLSSRTYEIPPIELGPGELLGELSYVQKKLPLASVLAVEPSTVLCVPRSDLDRKLKVDQGFEIRFTRVVNEFVTKRLYEIWTSSAEPESAPASEPDPPRDDADLRVYWLIEQMLNNEFSGELPREGKAEKDRGKGKDRKAKEEKGKNPEEGEER